MTLSRAMATAILNEFVGDFAIDPHDARTILADVETTGIDRETLADWLDGAGYPNLAVIVLYGDVEDSHDGVTRYRDGNRFTVVRDATGETLAQWQV